MSIRQVLRQSRTIEQLALEGQRMSRALGRSRRAEDLARRGELTLAGAEAGRDEARARARLLEQNVQASREQGEAARRELGDECREIERLGRILAEARDSIRRALQVS